MSTSTIGEVADLARRRDVPDQLGARDAASAADQVGAGEDEVAEEGGCSEEHEGGEMHDRLVICLY
jgi:hypothetical protein